MNIASPVDSSFMIAYPGEWSCRTGTVALVALSIIEYLRTEKESRLSLKKSQRQELEEKPSGYLEFLSFMQLPNKHFSQGLSLEKNRQDPRFSSYVDGESILCLIKAAMYLGYSRLLPEIEGSVIPLGKYYTADAWYQNIDSSQTKGFFQWSCMAFWEY